MGLINGIYKILCKENNMFYIGSSFNCQKRFSAHLNDLKRNAHTNILLQNCYNKYGINSLELQIIEITPETGKELLKIEQIWLDKCFDNCVMCMNINPIAGKGPDCSGKKRNLTNEQKQDLSKKMKGNTYKLGTTWSDTQRKIMSERMKGENNPMYNKEITEEHRNKLINSHKGKKCSEETKKKMSERMKGENHPMYGIKMKEEHKNKLINIHLGSKRTEETKQRMREAQQLRREREKLC
jgi:hypothetical protein